MMIFYDNELSFSNIGGRKSSNICDIVNGSSPAVDMQTLDVRKCFDKMGYRERYNDMFDVNVKVQNDKFALIARILI